MNYPEISHKVRTNIKQCFEEEEQEPTKEKAKEKEKAKPKAKVKAKVKEKAKAKAKAKVRGIPIRTDPRAKTRILWLWKIN